MSGARLIRASPEWFALQEEFRLRGVRASHAQLTQSLSLFIKNENLIPMLVKRAQTPKKRGLF